MDLTKKEFQLPENVNFDPENLSATYGRLYAEPLERGFGTTIGNALRRVLLSSITGAAVTSLKISGVLHEYSTLPGVKEDVIDIVFNVKRLKFRLNSEAPKVFSIKVKGPGAVTGKDIMTKADAMVLNPDQHIVTIEKNVNFQAELTVDKGRGYVSVDTEPDEDLSVDAISVDSIFTPITKVNFWVERARVGRSTDYDKLIMDIWTDGSITPPQALTQAADILRGHLAFFCLEKDTSSDDEKLREAKGEHQDNAALYNNNLLKSVDELELSVRSYNCLKNANISTIADLVQRSEQEMLRTKNFGRKSLNEIKEIIHGMGLHLNMRIDPEVLQNLSNKKGEDNAT